jgi:hypothetical protein
MNDAQLLTVTELLAKYGEHVSDILKNKPPLIRLMINHGRVITILPNGSHNYFKIGAPWDSNAWVCIRTVSKDGKVDGLHTDDVDDWPTAGLCGDPE